MIQLKLQQFRSDIRRDHIQGVIANKRITLLAEQMQRAKISETEHLMEVEVDKFRLPDNDYERLKQCAYQSQTEEGVRAINYMLPQNYFYPYFQTAFDGKKEQFYASFILCNQFTLQQAELPPQSFMLELLRVMEGPHARTVENCITLLDNLIVDFPQWRNVAILQYQLVQRVGHLFQLINSTPTYNAALINLLLRIFQKADVHPEFQLWRVPLYQLLVGSSKQTDKIYTRTLYCFNLIIEHFNQDIGQFMIEGRLAERLIQMVPHINTRNFTQQVVQTLTTGVAGVTLQVFEFMILPFLFNLAQIGYAFRTSTQASAYILKLSCYRLIYHALGSNALFNRVFCHSPIAGVMVQEFQMSRDCDTLSELIHVFSFALLDSSYDAQNTTHSEIVKLINRAQSLLPEKLELLKYFRDMDYMK